MFIFYFEAEVLMLTYNKTYSYLLLFLHPNVQAYHIIHKHRNGTQETSFRMTNSDVDQVLAVAK